MSGRVIWTKSDRDEVTCPQCGGCGWVYHDMPTALGSYVLVPDKCFYCSGIGTIMRPRKAQSIYAPVTPDE